MTSPRRLAAAGVALLLLLATLAACSGNETAGTPSDPTNERPATPGTGAPDTTVAAGGTDPVPQPIAWTPCHGELQCATLTVPIDYDDPSVGTIGLAVVRRPARYPDRRVASLIVNPGGPGGSGVGMVLRGYGTDGLNDRLDIVGWDPRGTNGSAPLGCASGASAFASLDPSPNDDAAQARLDDAAAAIAADCGARGGPLLQHMDSTNTARDLEQLRLATGGEPLTYVGYSYGTAIGLSYADRYPTHIRAMVLDGVVQPDQDLSQMLLGQTVAFDQQLQRTLDDCDHDRSCPVHGASATYDRVVARVEHAPLPTTDGRALGPSDLATAAIESTYDPSLTDPFLGALADADAGDGSAMMALADQYRDSAGYSGYVGVVCVDSPHPVGAASWRQFADRLAAASPRFGAAIANEVLPCAFWPAPVTQQPHTVTAEGSPPIVVIGNTGDPATPYGQAEDVARHLQHGVLVTVDARGHTSGGNSPCASSIVQRYLVDLATPPADSLCR
ncbi:MAG: alpha/beta hydrolase [Acidimicrobiales bacterium]